MASDRRSRATHRKAHAPCTSCQVDRHEKLARSSSRNLRPGPRKPARHGAQAISRNIRTISSAGRGWRRKAPSISPSSAPALPAVLHAHHAALRRAQCRRTATGAAVWPRQGPPPPYRSAGGRPTPRCGGSSRTSPTLAPRLPAPTPRPVGTHRPASAEPADGAQLPPPPPPARGATAPSSPPFPSHFTSHCWSIEAQSQSSGDRTGENIRNGGVLIERGTQAEVP